LLRFKTEFAFSLNRPASRSRRLPLGGACAKRPQQGTSSCGRTNVFDSIEIGIRNFQLVFINNLHYKLLLILIIKFKDPLRVKFMRRKIEC